MAIPDRKHSYVYGLEAEWLAGVYLRAKGYRILETRFRAAGGEIDLVAQRGGTLIFVEVKARDALDVARSSISADKCRRVTRAARVFLSRFHSLPPTIRFDALFLAPGHWPRHEKAIAELDLN